MPSPLPGPPPRSHFTPPPAKLLLDTLPTPSHPHSHVTTTSWILLRRCQMSRWWCWWWRSAPPWGNGWRGPRRLNCTREGGHTPHATIGRDVVGDGDDGRGVAGVARTERTGEVPWGRERMGEDWTSEG